MRKQKYIKSERPFVFIFIQISQVSEAVYVCLVDFHLQ